MKPVPTLLLTRPDVASLLTLAECIPAVEKTFELLGTGAAAPPAMLSVHAAAGGFHVKAGVLNLSRNYFAAKINANFPDNPARRGLPLIQGVIALFDGDNGVPLALVYERALSRGAGLQVNLSG